MICSEINYCIHEIRIRWYKKNLVNKNKFTESEIKKTEIKNSPEQVENKLRLSTRNWKKTKK